MVAKQSAWIRVAVGWPGWLLYLGAFLTPIAALPGYASWPHYGMTWLLVGPLVGGRLLLAPGTRLLGVAVLFAIAANVAILLRLPRALALSLMIAPWIAYASATVSGIVTVDAINHYLPCFYPWALGITLILGAQVMRAQDQ